MKRNDLIFNFLIIFRARRSRWHCYFSKRKSSIPNYLSFKSYLWTSCIHDRWAVVYKFLPSTMQAYLNFPCPLKRSSSPFSKLGHPKSDFSHWKRNLSHLLRSKLYGLWKTILMFFSLKESCMRLVLCGRALSRCHKISLRWIGLVRRHRYRSSEWRTSRIMNSALG